MYQEKKRLPFFGLPWTFTTYTVTEEVITVERGFLRRREDDCYLYRITDVRLETGLAERMFGLGTVQCYGDDRTDPVLYLSHIRNAKEIKDFILRQSEEARMRRRTVRTRALDGDGKEGNPFG